MKCLINNFTSIKMQTFVVFTLFLLFGPVFFFSECSNEQTKNHYKIKNCNFELLSLVQSNEIGRQMLFDFIGCNYPIVIAISFDVGYYSFYTNQFTILAEIPPGSNCSKEKIKDIKLSLLSEKNNYNRELNCYWEINNYFFTLFRDIYYLDSSTIRRKLEREIHVIGDSNLFKFLLDFVKSIDSCDYKWISPNNYSNPEYDQFFNFQSIECLDFSDFISKFNNCDRSVSLTSIENGLYFKIKDITYKDIKGKTLKLEMVFDNGDTLSCSKIIP